MNSHDYDDHEGVSTPYRPLPPATNRGRGILPSISLRPDWFEHDTVRAAGVLATWLWLCACGVVRQRGGQPYLSLTDVRRLVDFEELGVKAKTVIERAITAGLFAKTRDGIIVMTDALDDRRT